MACFDRVDCSVGLALLWDDSIRVSVRDVNFFYIDVDVTDLEDVQWRFTGFNGHPDTGKRHQSWDLLRSLCRKDRDRWVVVGDFNEILGLGEMSGGQIRDVDQITAFRTCLTDSNLDDMGAVGGQFT
ncbi:hypothetical protein ACLB2K_019559 [Fragaria x ananassa]